MDRRGFLKFFSAGVAGIALEQAVPLGRVWSFPKEIVVPRPKLTVDEIYGGWKVGSIIRVRIPQRWYVRDHSYAAIRENGWHFPTAAFPPDNSHTPS